MAACDASFSIGDSLRPDAIADSNDESQFAAAGKKLASLRVN